MYYIPLKNYKVAIKVATCIYNEDNTDLFLFNDYKYDV